MEDLLKFLKNQNQYLLWLVLSIVSIVLLCQRNPYHRGVWYGSANVIVGSVYELTNNLTGYFGLRAINEDLLYRVSQLEAENVHLKQQMQRYNDHDLYVADPGRQYDYTIAHVINNSICYAENYITLDKGAADGLRPNLGVTDQNGVVGIVARVSDHYAVVLSLLNPKLRLSVMLRHSQAFGSLVWNGGDPRYALLEDLPRNVKFQKGDTIVTTGYTSSFPKDIPVGRVVEAYDAAEDNNFLTLKIELFTDFDRINDVQVIFNRGQEEQLNLERQK